MKWTLAILVLASAVTLSSPSASAYGHKHRYASAYGYGHHYRSFYNSMNTMPGYWNGYYYSTVLPGGGMLDPGAAVNGSSPGGSSAGPGGGP
jgi:hypothetical protein